MESVGVMEKHGELWILNWVQAASLRQRRLEGGRLGSGDILDKITIITEGGTNKVVTAYPSKD